MYNAHTYEEDYILNMLLISVIVIAERGLNTDINNLHGYKNFSFSFAMIGHWA